MEQMIFRVCTLSDEDEHIESLACSSLPGWRNSKTGFWSKDLKNALALKDARDENSIWNTGGSSWSKIISTPISNVVIGDKNKFKNGSDDSFDSSEIFVTKVLDESKINIL